MWVFTGYIYLDQKHAMKGPFIASFHPLALGVNLCQLGQQIFTACLGELLVFTSSQGVQDLGTLAVAVCALLSRTNFFLLDCDHIFDQLQLTLCAGARRV